MFLGKYKLYFSGKNRLMLPRKIRVELGSEDRFYIILGIDGEIWGFNKENWQKQAEDVLKTPLSLVEGRVKRRNFFSRADECFLDRQGRFILPQEFVEKCDLKNEIGIIGAGDHFEIWDLKALDKVFLSSSRRT